ncbi:unnamed protein product [Rotaria magnacalcarata]|uniref:Sialate O-acetylesterase domain-containing protein n=1 Tax=Rotaria magnacalcarata TaxID=392030 RepID=A0A816XCC2_9BILA|nr:unnamed protein product [Rotaria magnacalcarata]CAF3875888.1 unnamed protein product [Rotaria magnacalcarata]
MNKIKQYFLIFLITFAAKIFAQQLQPASIFGNNMVLQQGIKVPVWGTAKPNEEITISFAGKKQKIKANASGNWMIYLKKLNAGGPFAMSFSSQENSVVFDSVFVGEVWLAGGQSNMQLKLPEAKNAGKEIAEANYPLIRFFTVDANISSKPLTKVGGEWLSCNPTNAKKFSAVSYFFARALHKDKNVPVGIISSSWGATPAEAWTSPDALLTYADFKDSALKYQQLQEDWEELYKKHRRVTDSLRQLNNKSKLPDNPVQKNYPTALYNAMIAPLVPYGIKGVIWYQGENNAAKSKQYRTLFPLLINDWRTKWKNEQLPFLYVQLANHQAKKPDPVLVDNWALLREAQTMTLQLPYTAMAVAIDIGDAKTIHPTNKQDVGQRLYIAANHIAYKEKNVYSGPQFKSVKIERDKIEISFNHLGSGLQNKGDSILGFAIAGADKKFYWATATIVNNKVIVSNDKVTTPVAVRYAWATNPDATLYNVEGLPAIPFRTDEW